MRLLGLLLLMPLLFGCASFGYNTLEDELSEQKESRDLVATLRQHFEIGEAHYKEGRLDLAEAEFKAMLELKPDEANALYRLGTLSFRQGKFDHSAEYFERTIKANPRNGKAHYNLASIRLMQAENHYKYYAALADRQQDLGDVTTLLGDIDKFNSNGKPASQSRSLDEIAGALKK